MHMMAEEEDSYREAYFWYNSGYFTLDNLKLRKKIITSLESFEPYKR